MLYCFNVMLLLDYSLLTATDMELCWLGCCNFSQVVTGLTPAVPLYIMTLNKLFTHVLMSPSSVIRYQKGGDAIQYSAAATFWVSQ